MSTEETGFEESARIAIDSVATSDAGGYSGIIGSRATRYRL